MSTPCELTRERATVEVGLEREWSPAVARHLASCGACRAWTAGLGRRVRALGGLGRVAAPDELARRVDAALAPQASGLRAAAHLARLERIPAPFELEGRTVAACHGGHRQERAVEHLRHLAHRRFGAPAGLAARLPELAPGGAAARAPRTLERAVAGDLADLPRALAQGFIGRLARRRVPAALERRLERALRRPRAALTLAATLAVVALVLGWTAGIAPFGAGRAGEARSGFAFEVVHAESPDALSPSARGFAEQVSGGLLSAALRAPDAPPDGRRPARAGDSPTAGEDDGVGIDAPGGAERGARNVELDLGPPLLERIGAAPFEIAYRGLRRVELYSHVLGPGVEIVYEEEVASDGGGRFAVTPTRVLWPPMSQSEEEMFLLMQKGREGFTYRFRDFRVRDAARFQQLYLVEVTGAEEVIAGRRCELLTVSRRDDPERLYRVAVDPETALVLRSEEFFLSGKLSGELIARTVFDTVELDPDLSDLELDDGVSAWKPFDPDSPLAPRPPFEMLRPTAVPDGFQLDHAALRDDPFGGTWVQLVYADGVEQVFLLHSAPGSASGSLGQSDSVVVYPLGAWTVVAGNLRGQPVIAMGKVHERELLLMLQSALE